jgi:hypothetical protein
MMKVEIPDYAIKILKREADTLEMCFSRIWGVLPKSVERDEIMWHLLSAKTKLNRLLEENNE